MGGYAAGITGYAVFFSDPVAWVILMPFTVIVRNNYLLSGWFVTGQSLIE